MNPAPKPIQQQRRANLWTPAPLVLMAGCCCPKDDLGREGTKPLPATLNNRMLCLQLCLVCICI